MVTPARDQGGGQSTDAARASGEPSSRKVTPMPTALIGYISTLLVTVGVPGALSTGLATAVVYGSASKSVQIVEEEPRT